MFLLYMYFDILGIFPCSVFFKKIIIPINLLKLCLGMQLSYLKIVWFFQVIRLRFFRQDLSNTEVRTNFQFSSVAQSCPTLCDPMDCCTPGFPVHHQLPELAQTHVHWVSDSIQPSHPLSYPSPPAFSLSKHQGIPKSMSPFFTSGGHNIGASASASVLPMNIQDWFPLGLTGLISLQSKGLSRVFSNTAVQKHQFFGAQLSLWSNSHIHTWLLEKP